MADKVPAVLFLMAGFIGRGRVKDKKAETETRSFGPDDKPLVTKPGGPDPP
jgi:hypothetical protein